jgi:hypothetical protein
VFHDPSHLGWGSANSEWHRRDAGRSPDSSSVDRTVRVGTEARGLPGEAKKPVEQHAKCAQRSRLLPRAPRRV